MLSRAAAVVVVRNYSRSAFKPIKFRHNSLSSPQHENVPIISTPLSHSDRQTQESDRDRKESTQRKKKSYRESQERHKRSIISESLDTSLDKAESVKRFQTRSEKHKLTPEDFKTSRYDRSLEKQSMKNTTFGYSEKPRTRFTTKLPSQSVEETLIRMGVNIKGEIIFGIFPVLLALQAKRRTIYHLIYKRGLEKSNDRIQDIITIAEELGVSTRSITPSQFKQVFQRDQVHQGVCLDASPLAFITLDEDNPEQEECKKRQSGEIGKQRECEEVNRKLSQQEKGETSQEGRNKWESEQGTEENQGGKTKHWETEMSQTGKEEEEYRFIHQGRNNQESHQTGRERKLWLYMDQIHDPMNFGAVLRSAYFMGVDKVLTTEFSSTRITSTVSKASAGVAEVFPVYQVQDPVRLAGSLLQAGWELLSSASGTSSDDGGTFMDVTAFRPRGNVLLIVGNEGKGISPELQQMCQTVVSISPGRSLHPHLQCLNVSAATALLLHGLRQRLSPQLAS